MMHNKFLVALFSVFLLLGGAFAWYSSDFSKRQQVNLTVASGSTQNDYQVFLNVSHDADMQNDFDDLRFVDDDDSTLLDAWLEQKSDGSWATVWVEVNDSISTVNRTVFMYYGNGSVGSYWNGYDTFIEFDGAEDGVGNWTEDSGLNSGDWNQNSSQFVTGSYCFEFKATGADMWYMDIADISSDDKAIGFWARKEDTTTGMVFEPQNFDGDRNTALTNIYTMFRNTGFITWFDGSHHNVQAYNADQWYKFDFTDVNFSNYSYDIVIDGSLQTDDASFRNNQGTLRQLEFYSGSTIGYVDNVFVREWHDPEPSGVFGAEESGVGPGAVGCSITVNDFNLTNGSWTGVNTPTANYSVTCYQSGDYHCDIVRNGTRVGRNASALNNASLNYILSNSSWGEFPPLFSAVVTCSNGTYSNSSSSTLVYVDSVSPVINVTYPANTTYLGGTGVTLNFTFNESNFNYCVWSLNGGANNTIGAVNGTSLTSSNGIHVVELWCYDNALNSVYDSVVFTIQSSANISFSEVTSYLPTQGMPRIFRTSYYSYSTVTKTVDPESGTISSAIDLGVSGSHFCDRIDSSNHLCLHGGYGSGPTYLTKYRTSDGALLVQWQYSGFTNRNPRGLACLSDGSGLCYTLVRNGGHTPTRWEVRRFNVSSGSLSAPVRSSTRSQWGGEPYGLAEAESGQWWIGLASVFPYTQANLTLWLSNFLVKVQDTNINITTDDYIDSDGTYLYVQTDPTVNYTVARRSLSDPSVLITNYTLKTSNASYQAGSSSGFFYDPSNDRVYFAWHRGSTPLNPYWNLNDTTSVPNATCNFTYGGFSANMSHIGGNLFQISVIENNSDRSSGIAVSSLCSAPGYSVEGASLSLETHNWITPLKTGSDTLFTVMGDYLDTSDFDGTDLYYPVASDAKKCVRFKLDGNSVNSSDTVDLYFFNYLHLGSVLGSQTVNLSVHPEVAVRPDLSSVLASCNLVLPNVTNLNPVFANCSASPNTTLSLGTDYFLCSNYSRVGVNTDGARDGDSWLYDSSVWSVVNKEYGLALVTENTVGSVTGNLTGFYVDGFIKDCGNQSGLQGVNVTLYQYNSTDKYVYTTLTESSGYFSVSDIKPNIRVFAIVTKGGYESAEDDFTLTSEYPHHTLAVPCLHLQIDESYSIETTFKLESNVTGGLEEVKTDSDHHPNATYRKDNFLSSVSFYVKDNKREEGVEDIDFTSASQVSTTCTFGINVTSYYFVSRGDGFYDLVALKAGTNQTVLYAWCADDDYFEVYYRSAGVNYKTRLNFEGFQMRATNVNVLTDSLSGYSWARASGDFYYVTPDESNRALDNNLTCSMRLEHTNTTNFTSWVVANTTGNTVRANFTSPAASPSTLLVHFNCSAAGFDGFDRQFAVKTGTDVFEKALCYISGPGGDRLDWHKKGELIQHECILRTYKNASLLDLVVRSKNFARNDERSLRYAMDLSNEWYFQTDLTMDTMPKGLHEWKTSMSSLPAGLKEANITYFQMVKVYWLPPEKISPDYCDGTTCPKTLYRGEDYFCRISTEFETEYTNIIMGIKKGGTGSLITVDHTDEFNPDTGLHVTSIRIPAVGETGEYGFLDDTTIQCYAELYIDNDHITYGQNPTNMLTNYYHEYPTDILGLQGLWSEFLASDEPMKYATGEVVSVPSMIMEKIAVTDAEGNIQPIIALLYLIGFALLAGLVIVFLNTRHKGGK
jgi:hypothetical protein